MSNLVQLAQNETVLKSQTVGYGVTKKYTPITTQDLLSSLADQGYVQTAFKATKVRKASKQGFQRHLTTLTHANFLKIGNDVPTAIIDNSYDGLSSLRLYAGLNVFVCENGLIMGKAIESYRLPHIGLTLNMVIECLEKITASLPEMAAKIERFKSIQLTDAQRIEFARNVSELAVPDTKESVNLQSVLAPRRAADASNSLWHVFNRGQESLIRGGIEYTTLTQTETGLVPRHNTTRAIKSIDRRVKMERAVWDLMESVAG